MENEYIRDLAMYAAIFGMFGFAWFGWAQENPPKKLRFSLGVGSVVCFVVACTGGYLALKHWTTGSALESDGAYQSFGVIVAIEIITALAGSLFFIFKRKNTRRVASWVAFVVGIHFIPLAMLFHDAWLYLLAFIVSAIAIISTKIALKRIEQNTFVCLLVGVTLLMFALRGLILYMKMQ